MYLPHFNLIVSIYAETEDLGLWLQGIQQTDSAIRLSVLNVTYSPSSDSSTIKTDSLNVECYIS